MRYEEITVPIETELYIHWLWQTILLTVHMISLLKWNYISWESSLFVCRAQYWSFSSVFFDFILGYKREVKSDETIFIVLCFILITSVNLTLWRWRTNNQGVIVDSLYPGSNKLFTCRTLSVLGIRTSICRHKNRETSYFSEAIFWAIFCKFLSWKGRSDIGWISKNLFVVDKNWQKICLVGKIQVLEHLKTSINSCFCESRNCW